MSNDGERGKKSWRDIDRGRDGSSHRSNAGGGGGRDGAGRRASSQAYRAYKTQLNKLFDGGGVLPEAMREKLGDAEVASGAKQRKDLLSAITKCASPKALREALAAYRDAHGFPDDEGALSKILELSSDEDDVLEAIQTVARLHGEGVLKRGASLKARIQTAQMTVDDPAVVRAAKDILSRL